MDFFDTLDRLCTLAGPSGFEHDVTEAAESLLKPLADQVFRDRLGNVVAVKHCGRPQAKRLLLDAHLDEIGFMVTGIEEGFLRFAPIGGVDPRMLPARELTILTRPEPLFGVVACLPPHVQTAADHDKAVKLEDLRVDIGMTQEEAERAVPIGTPMVYREGVTHLAGDTISGKALDDRSCFAILLRTLELLQTAPLDVDVYVMGSVQEETTGLGAVTGTNGLTPDWCVAVDVTFARTPGLTEDDAPCVLRGGPAIGVGPNMTGWMSQRMIEKARDLAIPYQLEVMEGSTGTNGWFMQVCQAGIPTSVVSLPLRYMHSPIETISEADMERTAQLLAAFAEGLGREAG